MADRLARPHTKECRERLEKLMKDNPRVQAARRRQTEFFENVAEEQDKKDKHSRRDAQEEEEARAKSAMWG